jgi:hypothetical protein
VRSCLTMFKNKPNLNVSRSNYHTHWKTGNGRKQRKEQELTGVKSPDLFMRSLRNLNTPEPSPIKHLMRNPLRRIKWSL